MELLSIKTAYGLAESLYGTSLSEEHFEDLALNAWELIGTKHSKLHKYTGKVIDGVLKLPCNVGTIESVTIPIHEAQTSHPVDDFISENVWTEHYIESQKKFVDSYYPSGKFVKYDVGDGELYFNKDYSEVTVIYHGYLLDKEGLPLINEKEMRAIAAYVSYVALYREGLMKRDSGLVQMSQMIKAEWLTFCNAARIPEFLSQNEVDEILEVKTCWDRKVHGKSYKPIR